MIGTTASPCPACGGPRIGNAPRDCRRCFPLRPFFRPAVDAVVDSGVIERTIAKAFGVPVALLREPDPYIEARRALERMEGEFMAATVRPFLEGLDHRLSDAREVSGLAEAAEALAAKVVGTSTPSGFPSRRPVSATCDHCLRSACHTRADACDDAPLGACRFRRMRAD